MSFRSTILVISCTLLSTQAFCQTTQNHLTPKHTLALYLGVGPNYYFNNLVIGKNRVNEFNYSFIGRFMWEPGHLLSVGVESGYYRLYTLTTPQPTNARIANSAVPIHIVVSMKFLKNFYFNFTMGQSMLINKASSDTYGNADAVTWSLADFGSSVGFRHRFKSRISIGMETRYYYSTGNDDSNIALVAMVGYNF
ncbi:MAG: hypothetical protein C5B59_20285 [Bacteroidetes bacterium]|nr:MAG: hypothetical protein C5B59_20285 [Bacteroidota bacterium]